MRENSATNLSHSAYPEVPRPAGADYDRTCIDNWETSDGRPYRLVWSRPLPIDNAWVVPVPGFADTDVRVVVTQFLDGSIATIGDDAPLVYVGGDDYTPESARALGAAIIAAADLAEQWTGVQR